MQKFLQKNLQKIYTKICKHQISDRLHHPMPDVDCLYLLRNSGGRVMIQLGLVAIQEWMLQLMIRRQEICKRIWVKS